VQNLLHDWSQYLQAARGLAPSSVTKYREHVERLLEQTRPADSLDFEALEAHLRRLLVAGYSRSSRRVAVSAIRSWCDYLVARGVLDTNPALHLARPRAYRQEAPHLSVAETRQLLFAGRLRAIPRDPMAARNRVLLAVMYIAGLRASEPGRLRTDTVAIQDPAKRLRLSILIEGAKASAEDVRQPLDHEVSRLLGAWMDIRRSWGGDGPHLFPGKTGRPLTYSGVHRIFRQAWRASGLEPRGRRITPHIMRHSLATHLLDAGHSIKFVQTWLRHKSITSTEIYLHGRSRAKLAGALERKHPLKRKEAPVVSLVEVARRVGVGV